MVQVVALPDKQLALLLLQPLAIATIAVECGTL